VTGWLKQPILVTCGSSHQPPSLTWSMDEQLSAEGEQYTKRERERQRWESRKKWERKSYGEESSVVELKFTLLITRSQSARTAYIRASEKGSFFPLTKVQVRPSFGMDGLSCLAWIRLGQSPL